MLGSSDGVQRMSSMSDGLISVNESLLYYPNRRLGQGYNSVVYEGVFDQMQVAVKQIFCKTDKTAEEIETETKLFRKIEKHRHKNIVGFYQSLAVGHYNYVVMEYCHGTLADFVKNETLRSTYPCYKIMKSMTRGLAYLHAINIAHRDLKPENIYYRTLSGGKTIQKFVLADFGISKCTMADMFTLTDQKGTLGYFPKEVCEALENARSQDSIKTYLKNDSDIFALGCLFYYIATSGKLPFGKNALESYSNIQRGAPPYLEPLSKQFQPLQSLLENMLSHDPKNRPTANTVLKHPALWSKTKSKNYFSDVNGYLLKCIEEGSFKVAELEMPDIIPEGGWIKRLPPAFQRYLNDFEMANKYVYRNNDNSVWVLLRALRNTETHVHELGDIILKEIGETPAERMAVWNNACPKLLMYLYDRFGDKMTQLSSDGKVYEDYMEVDTEENDSQQMCDQDYDQKNAIRYIYIDHAANGNLDAVKRYRDQGFQMDANDYDDRTALHLAAAEGHVNVVRYLLQECQLDPLLKDRWGQTARDEAVKNNHNLIVEIIDDIQAQKGTK